MIYISQNWRREHPFGFTAKPMLGADGETPDLFKWEAKIPGKKDVSQKLLVNSLFALFAIVSMGRWRLQNEP